MISIEERVSFLISFVKANFNLNSEYVQAVKTGAICGLTALAFLMLILLS
jgi:hypothetical protein